MHSMKSNIQTMYKRPKLTCIDGYSIDANTPTTEIVSTAITLIRTLHQINKLYATDLSVLCIYINDCLNRLKDRHDINQYHFDKLSVVLRSCKQLYSNVSNKPLFIKELSEFLKDRKDYVFVDRNEELVISLEKGQLRFVNNYYENQDASTSSITSAIQELNDRIEDKKNYVFVQKEENIDHSKLKSNDYNDYRDQGLNSTKYLVQQGATASHTSKVSDDLDDLDDFIVIAANENALDGEYISTYDGFELY